MKRPILKFTASLILVSVLLASCDNSARKVDRAEEEVEEANRKLEEANREYMKDIETARLETAEEVEANNKILTDFRERIKNENKKVRENYEVRMTELEQRNADMKRKMDEYRAEGKDKWENFKSEFNHDMHELRMAFKDLGKDNVKGGDTKAGTH